MTEIPKIETFEHDIIEEVKSKNTNIADIASYSSDSNNREKVNSYNFIFIVISSILILLSIILIITYIILSKKSEASSNIAQDNQNKLQINNGSKEKIIYLFPNLNSNVGDFISNFEETPFGYIVTISDFKEVFAFVIKNEGLMSEDILTAFKAKIPEGVTKENLFFKDITENNQNMRGLDIGDKTLVYSFLNDKYLLISKNKDGILSMRSAIIK